MARLTCQKNCKQGPKCKKRLSCPNCCLLCNVCGDHHCLHSNNLPNEPEKSEPKKPTTEIIHLYQKLKIEKQICLKDYTQFHHTLTALITAIKKKERPE